MSADIDPATLDAVSNILRPHVPAITPVAVADFIARLNTREPELITRDETLSLLHISRNTLISMRKEGIFRAYNIRGRLLYDRAEIIDYIHSTREHYVPPPR